MKSLFARLRRRILRLIDDIATGGRLGQISAHQADARESLRSIVALLDLIDLRLKESRQLEEAMFAQVQVAPERVMESVSPRVDAIDLRLQEARQLEAATLDAIDLRLQEARQLEAVTLDAIDLKLQEARQLEAAALDAIDLRLQESRQLEAATLDRIQAVGVQVGALVSALDSHTANLVARLSLLEYNLRDGLAKGEKRGASAAGGSRERRLYLDLLETSLTGELSADRAISPWSKGAYDPQTRFVGRDWPATALTMIGTARMRNLRHLLERVIAADVPGDFIETGAWRGGACIYAKGIMVAYDDTKRSVWVADSFRGLPQPTPELYPADAGDLHHTFGELAVSADDVRAGFTHYGLLDERVMFLEGWFKDTLPAAPIERLAILRLDGDMYESTMDALVALYDKVSKGGFVIVDDYLLPACAKAVHDFLGSREIAIRLEPVDGAAVFWEKGS